MSEIIKRSWTSPLGELLIASCSSRLIMTVWEEGKQREAIYRRIRQLAAADREVYGTSEIIERAIIQLEEYFTGQRRSFTLSLWPLGTVFQQRVWLELPRIPYGTTISYAQLAEKIRRPGAYRAVANANAVNPFAIIVPCHRVVGADGTLTGYNGGLEIKRELLEIEAAGLSQSALLQVSEPLL